MTDWRPSLTYAPGALEAFREQMRQLREEEKAEKRAARLAAIAEKQASQVFLPSPQEIPANGGVDGGGENRTPVRCRPDVAAEQRNRVRRLAAPRVRRDCDTRDPLLVRQVQGIPGLTRPRSLSRKQQVLLRWLVRGWVRPSAAVLAPLAESALNGAVA